MRKLRYSIVFAALMAMGLVSLTQAGGWAVVTLDQLPTQVVAGEPVAVSFMVRQHGRTPTNGFDPRIAAVRTETKEAFSVTPKQEGAEGHYVATLTFPSAGAWQWSIRTISLDQPMPLLNVLAPGSVKTESVPVSGMRSLPRSVPLLAGVVGLVGMTMAGLFWLRTRKRLALASFLLAAAVGVSGFASAIRQTATYAAQITAPAAQSVMANPAEIGKALFLAKGCIICHQHAAMSDARNEFSSLGVGPNLTNLSVAPEFLHRWLNDPSSVKPGTEMPTLGLSDEEIDALTAFLTGKQ
jgi:mono/diheme cytochrome c family protein